MFKECSLCRRGWPTLQDFLDDEKVEFIGMQLDSDLDRSCCLFFFQHEPPDCRTSLTLTANQLEGLIEEPIPESSLAFQERCPGYCGDINTFILCTNPCRNAPFRKLAERLRRTMGQNPRS